MTVSNDKSMYFASEIFSFIFLFGLFLGGGGVPEQLNPKWQDLSKSAFSMGAGGGGGGLVVSDQLNAKSQDVSKSAFSGRGQEGGGGWWWSRLTFLKYLSGSAQGILNQNFNHWS